MEAVTRPYISVETQPRATQGEWLTWVEANDLSRCYRLEALDDSLTQWVGWFYATTATGKLALRCGDVVRQERAVVTTPARPEWVAA